jgi:hypothetical protein
MVPKPGGEDPISKWEPLWIVQLRTESQCCFPCVFITAGPITKLFAAGEEESGGHVL